MYDNFEKNYFYNLSVKDRICGTPSLKEKTRPDLTFSLGGLSSKEFT